MVFFPFLATKKLFDTSCVDFYVPEDGDITFYKRWSEFNKMMSNCLIWARLF